MTGATEGEIMPLGYRRFGTSAVAGLLAIGLAACDPPPPRLQLTVDSTLAGADDDPGDGVCSSAAAGGACTLRAAIDEGNAAPDGADLTVPAGHYKNVDTTITGDVAVNPVSPADVKITDSTFTVAAGARLALSGINTSTSIQSALPSFPDNPATDTSLLELDVSGIVVVTRSVVRGIDIAAGGGAVVVDSIVETTGTVNHGGLIALRSSFLLDAIDGPDGTVLTTGAGAGSHLTGSVLAVPHTHADPFNFDFPGGEGTCAGAAPSSGSHMHVEDPCGPMTGTGDGSGDAGTTLLVTYIYNGLGYREVGSVYGLQPASPLIDAIPLGDPACPDGAVDVYGQPRGVDGDGDGTGGCDIGAVERQP